ncbi:MAG: DUF2029 domain-containing protein [Acidobacteria bacterium]|nr:DUF2029 domain-containing protein [Acidobacteriota bacterium]
MSTVARVAAASPDAGRPTARRGWRSFLGPWVAAGLIAGIWLTAVFRQAVLHGRPGDFSSFYCGGEILRTRGPAALYDYQALQQCHARHFSEQDAVLPFIRPPFYALALAPLSLLPPHPALLAWLAINLVALAGAIYFTARATGVGLPEAAWHAAIFFPAVATFLNRQDLPIILFWAAAGYWLTARGRYFAAGSILALCAMKFHLVLLLSLAFLAKKNWKALRGLLTGVGILAAVSLWMLGPAGLTRYVQVLLYRSLPNIENYPVRQTNLFNLAGGAWLSIPLVLLTVAAVVTAGRRLSQTQALAAAWLGSLLVAPHVVISDYLLALPACLSLAPLSRYCFLASLLLLFPVVPVLLAYDERLVLAAPFLALACLIGAAVASVRTPLLRHD